MRDRNAMSFDQYQRYATAGWLIEAMREMSTPLKVLEIGANVHRNLEVFLPTDSVTYLDRDLPENLATDPAFVRGDATALDFPDGAFDVVVSLDVFEHIPPPLRPRFLSEANRVSRIAFVLGAPFDTTDVRTNERVANEFYARLNGAPHRWLQEHADEGLPDLASTLTAIDKFGRHILHFEHGNLRTWLALTEAGFADNRLPKTVPDIEWLGNLYNRFVYPVDVTSPCYRQFIVAARGAETIARCEAARRTTLHAGSDASQTILQECARNVGPLAEMLANALRSIDREAALDAQLASVYSSTSWRVTTPLRWMRERLRG